MDSGIEHLVIEALKALTMHCPVFPVTFDADAAVEAIVKAMRRHAESREVQGWACSALDYLVKPDNEEGRFRAIKAGAFEAVVAALRSLDPSNPGQELFWGSLFLSKGNVEHKICAGNAGAVEALMAVLRALTSSIKETPWWMLFTQTTKDVDDENIHMNQVYEALHKLLDASDPLLVENLTRARNVGGVEALVCAMHRHPGAEYTMKSACDVLDALTGGYTEIMTRADSAGAVKAVMAILQRGASGGNWVQTRALEILQNLTCSNSENRNLALDAGAIKVLVTTMHGHNFYLLAIDRFDVTRNCPPQFHQYAMATLCNLTTDSAESTTQAGNAGVVETLVSAMRAFEPHEGVQRHACLLLTSLTSHNAENMSRAGNAGAVEAVVAALRCHTENCAMQELACGVLCLLTSLNAGNITRAGNANAIEAIVLAMRTHADETGLLLNACRGLCNLISHDADNVSLAGTVGAVDVVVAAIRRHASNTLVQDTACVTLFHLTIGNEENKRRADDASAIEAVIGAMRGGGCAISQGEMRA